MPDSSQKTSPASPVLEKLPAGRRGVSFERFFTTPEAHPFESVPWVLRDAALGGEKKVFEQRQVEFPAFWSDNAVNITASKYFRGKLGTPEREWSVKQMIGRVTQTVRHWGEEFGYFATSEHARAFEEELAYLIVHQYASFNSPVWFNVGATLKPQCSACFILNVEDNMESILEWIRTEAMIFKGGSGSGINLSKIRSGRESLSRGGRASGPVSFMRGADSVAGMIKSGGTTRRAAKMVILNIDHPDIVEFIRCKADEEKKVRALIAAGYSMANINDEAWHSIQYQNANNSVRITDTFMRAAGASEAWQTRYRTTGEVAGTHRASDLLMEVARAAWECGDPGVQFDTTVNTWHTCPNSGPIEASNPCSEYMHLNNSACNLASLNLIKFLREDGTFMVEAFKRASSTFILAQDIIVSGSSYPTERIGENARAFRQLGLGFANLGTFLMAQGLPYDSDTAAVWSGALSALMAGEAYRYSAQVASTQGAFAGFLENREPMLRVIEMHRDAAYAIPDDPCVDPALLTEARAVWDAALEEGRVHGFRNSQTTVIAPTGTISFMMDCATTGCEPAFSLVSMKQLVGGGWMKLVSDAVPAALRRLGYSEQAIVAITQWIAERGSIEGAPDLKPEHLPVFDCAVQSSSAARAISWRGHVRIVAAIQPFISGAISKTFNMPNETTVEEVYEAYLTAWKLGIKAFAVYRDGCKVNQPLLTKGGEKERDASTAPSDPASPVPSPVPASPSSGVRRRRLPTTHVSETHKFSVAGHSGYLTYSCFEDGSPAEIFIRIAKQGSTLLGLLDSFAIAVSVALQYGVPFKDLARKFVYTRFEPSGITKNPDIRVATSIVDYIFRYLSIKFLSADELLDLGMTESNGNGSVSGGSSGLTPLSGGMAGEGENAIKKEVVPSAERVAEPHSGETSLATYSDTVCRQCGGMMVRSGSCLTCKQCGTSSGGCS